MNNLYQILSEATDKYPDHCALIFQEHRISYQQLKEATDRLAGSLADLSLEKGDRVALMLPNIPHFVMTYFALLKLGITIVPVSIYFKADEIRHQLEDAEVKGIIYWEGFRKRVHQAIYELETCRRLIVLGQSTEPGERLLTSMIENHAPLEEIVDVEPDHTALIVYTAGNTGRPRGAELSHLNLLSNAKSCQKFFRLKDTDGVIGVIPLFHPLGHTLVLGAFLSAGARVVLLTKFQGHQVLECVEKEKISYLIGVPSMYREFIQLEDTDQWDLSSLAACLSVGDSLKEETLDIFESHFNVPLLEGYGLSEASPMVSFNSPSHERKAGSIGMALPGVDMRIVDDYGGEVAMGQIGEIIVRGDNVMKGYLNKPEATKEALKDGWLHTGDFAQVGENGFGFVVVRKKNVIIKSGFNVYPREVEKFLSGHPKIKESAVIGVPDAVHGEEIHACIVLKANEQAAESEIINYTKERIAAYKCPNTIHFYESLPKDPTGRVLREKLKQDLVHILK